MSAIEWTDKTWNPIRGCSVVSAGCEKCYAMRQAHRFNFAAHPAKDGHPAPPSPGPYAGLTRMTSHGPKWTGDIRLVPEKLDEPLRWRKPRRVFVNSMSDLFHEDVPDWFIDRVFGVMALSPRHTFQVLTKRPERMRRYLTDECEASWGTSDLPPRRDCAVWAGARHMLSGTGKDIYEEIEMPEHGVGPRGIGIKQWPLPNVWLGVSAENEATLVERAPLLFKTPAAVRFLSAEPLLGPLRFDVDSPLSQAMEPTAPFPAELLDWVIVGGESGPGARPCRVRWIYSIVEQCKAAAVPCFVKQLGSNTDPIWQLKHRKGGDPSEWPEDLRVREMPERYQSESTSSPRSIGDRSR